MGKVQGCEAPIHNQPAKDVLVNMRQQVDADIYSRCAIMLPVFFVLWLGVVWSSGFYQAATDFARLILLVFGVIGLVQGVFALAQVRLYRISTAAWRFFFYCLLFACAFIWGGLFAACFFDDNFQGLFLPMTLVTAGVANAMLSHLAPNRWVAQSYVSVLLLPAVFVCFSNKEQVTMGAAVLGYWFYCLLIL